MGVRISLFLFYCQSRVDGVLLIKNDNDKDRIYMVVGRRRVVVSAGARYLQRGPAGGCFTIICHHLHI